LRVGIDISFEEFVAAQLTESHATVNVQSSAAARDDAHQVA
jgi:hypothetical protein